MTRNSFERGHPCPLLILCVAIVVNPAAGIGQTRRVPPSDRMPSAGSLFMAFEPSSDHPHGRMNPDAPPDTTAYASMIGDWECIERRRNVGEEWEELDSRISVSWFLNGYGIRNHTYLPESTSSMTYEYDATRDRWTITNATAPSFEHSEWIGEREGDRMVASRKTTGPSGKPLTLRISFFNIEQSRYDWKLEAASTQGRMPLRIRSCTRIEVESPLGGQASTGPPNSSATLSYVEVNGIRMRIAQEGRGRLVLLLHGFPGLWYSWRRQMPALARAGYRAVAPDMRGYGGTDAPLEIDAYDALDLCGDVLGLIDALGERRAVLVGHDWGAAVAWYCALLEPDRFDGVVAMSVPWRVRSAGGIAPTVALREAAGEEFHYMLFFQEPGVAESELEGRTREFMRKLLTSPNTPREPPKIVDSRASAGGFIDRLGMPTELPSWLAPEALDYFVGEFDRSGFRGGLNYYRNLDRSWDLTKHLVGARIKVPALFIAGDEEFLIRGRDKTDLLETMREVAPMVQVELLEGGVGHWLQEQAPDLVNQLLIEFVNRIYSNDA